MDLTGKPLKKGVRPTIATRRRSQDLGVRPVLIDSIHWSVTSSDRIFRFSLPYNFSAFALNSFNLHLSIARSVDFSERLICLPRTLISAKYVVCALRYKPLPR